MSMAGTLRAAVGRRRLLGVLLSGAVLLLAPLTAVDAADAGDQRGLSNASSHTKTATSLAETAPEDLGGPVSIVGVLDNVLGRDRDGRLVLYGATYSNPNDATFYSVDPMSGRVLKQIPMPGTFGAFNAVVSPVDGKVYLTSQPSPGGPAALWMYDPQTEELSVVATDPGQGLFLGLTVASSGKVYFGSAPDSILYAYDPRDGSVTKLGEIQPDEGQYRQVFTMTELPRQRLLVGSSTPARLSVVDAQSGRVLREILPEEYHGYSFPQEIHKIGGEYLVTVAVPDTRVLRFDARTLRFKGEVAGLAPGFAIYFGLAASRSGGDTFFGQQSDEDGSHYVKVDLGRGTIVNKVRADWVGRHVWRIDDGSPYDGGRPPDSDSWYVSIGAHGTWGRWNPETGELVTAAVELPGVETLITAVGTGPDGNIYGGTYETQHLFSFDASTEQMTDHGLLHNQGLGQIQAMVSTNGKLFAGTYTHGRMTVYDPDRPWNPGNDPDDNPYHLGRMGDVPYRPNDGVLGSDGRVWIASTPEWGRFGGGLTAIDPTTYAMQNYDNLAGDHALQALAAGDGELYIGTTRQGNGVVADGDARLQVFDIASSQVVFDEVPVSGANYVFALAQAPNNLVYGTTDTGAWFTFDPSSRTITSLGSFPGGAIRGLITGPDGYLYAITADAVYQIDPDTLATVRLAGSDNRVFRTLAFDGQGRLYWADNTRLMRMTPPS